MTPINIADQIVNQSELVNQENEVKVLKQESKDIDKCNGIERSSVLKKND